MSLQTIDPKNAKQLLDRGAVLVDIRELDERARNWIPGTHHLPLSKLGEAEPALNAGRPVIFHCKSGARTLANANRLADKLGGSCEAYIVDGGLEAWVKAGLPVATNRRQPIELNRQVQIVAGSLILAGTALGAFASVWFLALTAFVGAGLLTAGITGFCGMQRILMKAPWNRLSARPASLVRTT